MPSGSPRRRTSPRRRRKREESEESDESVDFFRNGCFVRPTQISDSARQRLRSVYGTPEWRCERRSGYVRPPLQLPCGAPCPISDLGECGDRKCGNYRLGNYSDVRPSFLKFCVHYIQQALPEKALAEGIVYCSLGSGQLFFDWELLERLIRVEGVRITAAHLIDKDYGGKSKRESALRAQRTFAGWFADQDAMQIRSFLSPQDYERWVKRSDEMAHVFLDCDAVGARKKLDVSAFRNAVLHLGGICLVLSNPAKRTALLKVEAGLEQHAQHVYRRGAWRLRKDVSASRSRSRRRDRKNDGRSGRRDRCRQRQRRRRRDDEVEPDEGHEDRKRGSEADNSGTVGSPERGKGHRHAASKRRHSCSRGRSLRRGRRRDRGKNEVV